MTTLRGHHVGAAGSAPRTAAEPRRSPGGVVSHLVSFWCHAGHTTTVRLAADVAVPLSWQCARCGAPAGPDPDRPPTAEPGHDRGRTHLECLQMRRTPEEGKRALAEALALLRARRRAGEIL
jgi:RNA polymerase binding protein RbpA